MSTFQELQQFLDARDQKHAGELAAQQARAAFLKLELQDFMAHVFRGEEGALSRARLDVINTLMRNHPELQGEIEALTSAPAAPKNADEKEAAPPKSDTPAVLLEVIERRRAQVDKGYTAAHDDQHHPDELIQGACYYAMTALGNPHLVDVEWPWDGEPPGRGLVGARILAPYLAPGQVPLIERHLLDAAALLIAAVERIRRARGV